MSEPPFVGREREQAELRRRLVPGALVTLTGPAGVGKSRLARRVGGISVGLREARDVGGLWDALAMAAGVAASADVRAEVASTLGPECVLLDDADEVPAEAIDELAHTIDAPILVTSRRRLGLGAEVLVELAPLDESDGVALVGAWLDRLRGRGPSDAEEPWVRELVQLVDGLPLAIELAVARCRVLGPAAIVRRLRESPTLVAGGLDVAFAWSWDSLEPVAREALAQLTVFVGGFDVDAAEAIVVLEGGVTPERRDVLDVLALLRDRSLVRAIDDVPRLDLLSTFARFVRARSDAHTIRDAEARHAAYFAARLANEWSTAEELERRLAERGNVLALVDRLRARTVPSADEANVALQALLAIAPTLLVCGPLLALVERLDPALEASTRSGADLALLTRASAMRARARARTGDLERAASDLSRARLLAAKAGDPGGEVARAGVEVALARGEDASAWLAALGDDPESALLDARDALRRGDVARARARCAVAERGDRFTALGAQVLRAQLGDPQPLGALLDEAEALGDVASCARLRSLRDETATARRLAERLGDAALIAELAALHTRTEPPVLRVAADGSAFELPERRVDLSSRKTLRTLLARLVVGHAAGEPPLPWDTLLSAGWPGERVSAEAGIQRVRVAVSTLRKLGLGELVQTIEGGYRLDPRARVETF